MALIEEDAFASTSITVPKKSEVDPQFLFDLRRKFVRGDGVPVNKERAFALFKSGLVNQPLLPLNDIKPLLGERELY